MHKKPAAGKKSTPRKGPRDPRAPVPAASRPGVNIARGRFHNIPRSVNDLLSRQPLLGELARALPAQRSWLAWLRERLEAPLAAHLMNASAAPGTPGVDGELIVYADAPAWCARLRYALAGLSGELRAREPTLGRFRVRVWRDGPDGAAPADREPGSGGQGHRRGGNTRRHE